MVFRSKLSLIARFMSHVDVTEYHWLWTASVRGKGYGQWKESSNKGVRAHRWSYEYFVGPIHDGLYVLHKCDTPACVRPDHLFLGTHQDNMDDMVSKGRQVFHNQVGEANGNKKLTDSEVNIIRELFNQGYNQCELGRIFGVTNANIHCIVRNKGWKHLHPDYLK